jgi:NitT/TauT family transport system substrate-binding protein
MRRFRPALAGLAALLCAAASAGCSSSPSSSSPPVKTASSAASPTASASSTAPELSSLTVGVLPAVNTATLYLAIKEGYFAQVGLTVTPQQLAVSNDAIPGLLHGTIDISSGNLDSYLAADAAGVLPLRILNETAICSPDTLAVLAKPSSGITNAAGLAGKTIAVATKPDIQTLTINNLVGPAEAKTLHYVAMPFQDMLAALAAGRVDTIATLQPYIAAAEHTDGASVVLDQCGGANAGLPLGGYFATASWVAKYPNTARAFQAAMNKAQALANSNPALVRQLLPTFMKVTAQVAKGVAIPQFATDLNAAQIQIIANLAFQGGEAKSQVNVTPLLVG